MIHCDLQSEGNSGGAENDAAIQSGGGMNLTNPKQIKAVNRMEKRGFAVDYTARRGFNPCVYMSRVANGLKRYAQVTIDGLVNGRDVMAFV